MDEIYETGGGQPKTVTHPLLSVLPRHRSWPYYPQPCLKLNALCWDLLRQTSRSWRCHLVERRGFGGEDTLHHYQTVALDTS